MGLPRLLEVLAVTPVVDLTGRVFGRLIVTERAMNGPRGTARWSCKCECGEVVEHYSSNLIRGRSTKCDTACVLATGRRPWPRDPRYYVGRDGSIVSPSGVLLKHWLNDKGYPVVGVYPDGKNRPIGVHVMVAEAYLGPRPEGLQAAHGDGNPGNPSADNLRWATPTENAADKVRHGTQLQGEQVHTAKLTDEIVRAIRQAAAAGVSHRALGTQYGVTRTNIGYIVRRATWKHVS